MSRKDVTEHHRNDSATSRDLLRMVAHQRPDVGAEWILGVGGPEAIVTWHKRQPGSKVSGILGGAETADEDEKNTM